jgi:hypothetical protein
VECPVQKPLFDDNKELKEFVMTLTGTLIFGENSEITPLPARTTDQDLIKAMMEGGRLKSTTAMIRINVSRWWPMPA